MNCKDVQVQIDVYLDKELTLSDSRDFEDHLAGCKNCQLMLESARSLSDSIHNVAYVNAPFSLQRKIKKDLKDNIGDDGAIYNKLQLLAVGISSVALTSIAAWAILSFTTSLSLQTQLVDALTEAHVRSLMVDHATDITTSDNHTIKPWFNGKLDFSPAVKDLTSEGFPLVGGRLEYLNKQSAAALVYKRRAHFINVFIFRDSEDGAVQQQKTMQSQSYNLVSWNNRGLNYWAISDLNKDELNQFSHLLAAQLYMPAQEAN